MMTLAQYSLILKLTDPDPKNRPSIANIIKEFKQMLSLFQESNFTTTQTTNEINNNNEIPIVQRHRDSTKTPPKYLSKTDYAELKQKQQQ
jgi:hypothetical protein